MKIIATILWFLIFNKAVLFWLWLWQLKEYHLGRFGAHFETQEVKKTLVSFWRLKFPKFTKKITLILVSLMLLEFLLILAIFSLPDNAYYFYLLILTILSPAVSSFIVLAFQIPTVIFRNRLLERAKQKRERYKKLTVIGITGSYGKTSTKEFLAAILSGKFKVLKTKEHINAEIGIAQTILQELEPLHEVFVAEIGAYERGKIKQVCQMLQPKIGVLTGINEQHMACFGSQQEIIEAKYELIEALPYDGLAVFNGSNKYCRRLYQKTKKRKKIIVGSDESEQAIEGLLPWDKENFFLAQAVAKELGMSEAEIAKANKKIKSQTKIEKGLNQANVINNAYSSNPHSVLAHLDYLKTKKGKKAIVMPCLIELGASSKQVHQRIGEKIGQVCDLAVITTKDRFKELEQGAVKSGMLADKIIFSDKAKDIFERLKEFTESDIILLESRVPNALIRMLLKHGS